MSCPSAKVICFAVVVVVVAVVVVVVVVVRSQDKTESTRGPASDSQASHGVRTA